MNPIHRHRIQVHFFQTKSSEYTSAFDRMEWPITCEQLCEVGEIELR